MIVKDHRPQSLTEYVGQENIKDQIKKAIEASKTRSEPFGHTLLTGFAGCGKSSLSQVIALERGVDFQSILGASVSKPEDLKEMLRTKLNSEGYVNNDMNPKFPEQIKPTILFIDEIHNLNKKIRETLYTVMEDRIYWDEKKNPWSARKTYLKTWVPHFTLIGATTEEGCLEKPFRDRFRYHFHLERYTIEECMVFVRSRLSKKEVQYEEEVILEIAKRARGVARIAIQLTDACVDYMYGSKISILNKSVTDKAFDAMQIDELGLKIEEIKIIKYLSKCYRPTGLKSLASALEISMQSLENNYEPFLAFKDLIRRTPQGRVITENGIKLLKERNLIEFEDSRVLEEINA